MGGALLWSRTLIFSLFVCFVKCMSIGFVVCSTVLVISSLIMVGLLARCCGVD